MNWVVDEFLNDLPSKGSTPQMGWVYILEYGDDLKIGCTKNLKNRINTLKNQAEVYGNKRIGVLVYSKEHTNYRDNEKILHHHFESCRKEHSELFHMSLNDFLKNKPCIDFLDESVKIQNEGTEFLNIVKNHIVGKNNVLNNKVVLTTDDYLKAAELIADCSDESLSFILDLLKSKGFIIKN